MKDSDSFVFSRPPSLNKSCEEIHHGTKKLKTVDLAYKNFQRENAFIMFILQKSLKCKIHSNFDQQ